MAILQQHYDLIKAEFEKEKGWLLYLRLTNKRYLIKDFLPEYPYEHPIFFESTSFHWYEFSNTATQRDNGFVVRTSFLAIGILIFYEQYTESSRKEITLDLAAEILCTYYPEFGSIVYNREDITVLTGELKKIKAFDEIVLNEFNSLTMLKPLTAGIYDKTWRFNEKGNKIQEFISSLYYFYEIENVYRQVKYSIALANSYAHYANDYFPRVEIEPFIYYPLNFTSHDRRYLDYCTNAIHNMYVYWERLALLIFHYYKPQKVNDGNLSFARLIRQIVKQQNSGQNNLNWFITFLENDHSRLQLLRHPLVHFKLDTARHKGSYVAMIHTHWLKNIQNQTELTELEDTSRKLIDEIIDLAKKCHDGYDRTIQLIVDLRSTQDTPD